ncbi:transposase domain-containing protein [Waterburya agarophytonicola K14]|uniref:Transposase domain-containing protein n=1 Tax=Waterburya agarophytonicola KI4 TaxID=2874699 RepID=A0A964BTU3_9CYAN|nr:transposase domain-containing protein [Waterburya agarophytonicola]MCC0179704.1 transposase domain-containing protein [Waterburya agarophytonicola KI4]
MQLKKFTLINPKLEASLVFQAIETVIQAEMIEVALKKSNSLESRRRKLTSSLVVCLIIAMSYWSSDSMTTVLKNLVNGLNKQWTKLGQSWKTPVSSSITEARQRLGCQVMSQSFKIIAFGERINAIDVG